MNYNPRPGPQKQEASGAEARFSFDRMAVERFQQAFPRARWSDERKSWFVPGTTAARRIERWLAQEAALRTPHDDSKGRDTFALIQYRANIWRLRTTCAFVRPTGGQCLKSCAPSRGRVGTTNCGPGEFHFAHMTSSGAGGQASKKLLTMPSRRKGNGDVWTPEILKPTEPRANWLLNAGVTAIRCQLTINLAWDALSQPSSTGSLSSLTFPVKWSRHQTQLPFILTQWLRTASSFGADGARLRWLNL